MMKMIGLNKRVHNSGFIRIPRLVCELSDRSAATLRFDGASYKFREKGKINQILYLYQYFNKA